MASMKLKFYYRLQRAEAGITMLEFLVVSAIAGIMLGTTTIGIDRIMADTRRTNDSLITRISAENAALWIGRDAAMADAIITTGLLAPDFMVINWTEWGYDSDSVYHTVTYSVENPGGLGKLTRRHQTSTGVDEATRVCETIYLDATDPAGTSSAVMSDNILSLKLVGKSGAATVTKEIKVFPRPNFSAQ